MGYLSNFIVYTLAMVGVMMLALIVFKNSTGCGVKKSSKFLNVLDTMSLGPRKTLYIVSAGEEKFLIAADVDKTTLISKLDLQNSFEERITPVATTETEDFSTKSFKDEKNRNVEIDKLFSKRNSYIDRSVIGINSNKLNAKGLGVSRSNSVMKNLAQRMNAEVGGGK